MSEPNDTSAGRELLRPRRTRRDATPTLPRLRDRYALAGLAQGVSPICLGAGRAGGDPRAIPAAFDAGINFFFLTADLHWPHYEASRRGLELLFQRRGVRDDVVVGVVSYMTQPEFMRLPFEEVVEAVKGLGRVDLTILGGVYAGELAGRLAGHAEHCVGAPHVGPRGASFHDRGELVSAVNEERVDVAFLRYNPAHPGADEDVFPLLRPEGRCLLYNFKSSRPFMPEERLQELGLGAENWRPEVPDYYRFALTSPVVDGLLCGLDDERQVAALEAGLARGPLDEDERRYLCDLASLDDGSVAIAR